MPGFRLARLTINRQVISAMVSTSMSVLQQGLTGGDEVDNLLKALPAVPAQWNYRLDKFNLNALIGKYFSVILGYLVAMRNLRQLKDHRCDYPAAWLQTSGNIRIWWSEVRRSSAVPAGCLADNSQIGAAVFDIGWDVGGSYDHVAFSGG
jgi:hypothetical protein